jgi:hypothetical protein
MQDTQAITDEDLFDEHRIEEEEVTEEIPKERRNIHFKTPTRTVIDIYSSFKRHDLDPKPNPTQLYSFKITHLAIFFVIDFFHINTPKIASQINDVNVERSPTIG